MIEGRLTIVQTPSKPSSKKSAKLMATAVTTESVASVARPVNPAGSSHKYVNDDADGGSPFRITDGCELAGWGYLHIA